MKSLRCLASGTLWVVCVFVTAVCLSAQEPAPLTRRIVLPGESADVVAQLKAADRLIETTDSPSLSAALVGLAGSPPPFLHWPLTSSAFVDQMVQGDWSAALDEYQRMIYDDGDTLAPDESRESGLPILRSVPVRWLCHRRIAAAPPHALALYRKRVDALAEKLFREGEANRDRKILQRLVSDLFCSRFGDRALDLLGDLAFERGEFAQAVEWWRLLALPAVAVGCVAGAPEDSNAAPKPSGHWQRTLLFPAPRVDLARVRAKGILALAFAGEQKQAARELQTFRDLHGSARGKLAGREGEYAGIVEDVIRRLPAVQDEREPWSTFAGTASRNRVLAAIPSPRSWANGPTWRVALPTAGFTERADLFSQLVARLRYHPVIAGDRVLLTDGRSVFAMICSTAACCFATTCRSPIRSLPQFRVPTRRCGPA